ncbi:hypothetical protein LCGC14_0983610 [marine sediment metagenome]|uniref:Uncharacterized protein n=1 Tax=marine sediment metagenome TaxID=412755 RepID=A0A0F9NCG9_9ZZZZ
MAQQEFISRYLEFVGAAQWTPNMRGNPLSQKTHFYDEFTGDTLDTNKWAVTTNGNGSIAISEIEGGVALMTTGTTDNDSQMLSTSIIWTGTKNVVLYARIHMVDVSGTALFVGISDAKSESNNIIAIEFPLDNLTTQAVTAAGFVIDADHDTSSIMCAGVAGNTDTTPVDTGIDWEDGETKDLVLIFDGAICRYYVDGVEYAAIAASITATTLHCGTIQAQTRAADGSNVIRCYRFHMWQDV